MKKILAADADLDSFVVMPNHVHVLWSPHGSHGRLMQLVKGATALEANRILGRTGKKFWQEEYFDRHVRSNDEAVRIRRYIEWNPVKAGIAAAPEEYPWSSARLLAHGSESALKRRAD